MICLAGHSTKMVGWTFRLDPYSFYGLYGDKPKAFFVINSFSVTLNEGAVVVGLGPLNERPTFIDRGSLHMIPFTRPCNEASSSEHVSLNWPNQVRAPARPHVTQLPIDYLIRPSDLPTDPFALALVSRSLYRPVWHVGLYYFYWRGFTVAYGRDRPSFNTENSHGWELGMFPERFMIISL